jgi:hypothetical protein
MHHRLVAPTKKFVKDVRSVSCCSTTDLWHLQKGICRVGQNHIYTTYMTVYLMISLSELLYIHRIYMVLANPKNM